MLDLSQYLNDSPNNISVVHCMAGKGRTGLVICAYLLFANIYATPNDAITFFAFKRSSDGSARVENASQKRYLILYQ